MCSVGWACIDWINVVFTIRVIVRRSLRRSLAWQRAWMVGRHDYLTTVRTLYIDEALMKHWWSIYEALMNHLCSIDESLQNSRMGEMTSSPHAAKQQVRSFMFLERVQLLRRSRIRTNGWSSFSIGSVPCWVGFINPSYHLVPNRGLPTNHTP